MKFVTVRDFRLKPAFIWQELEKGGQVVLTLNGKPMGILTGTNGDQIEEDLDTWRIAKANRSINRMRTQAELRGLDKLSMKDIDKLIDKTRKVRRK